jgi:nucleoside-diphosphate-sugar epimerase
MESTELVLVTGGTGSVGANCILQLLQRGYAVRTTLRDVRKKNEIVKMLRNGGVTVTDQLSFVEADITKDGNWDKALKGCRYVLHVASPTHIENANEDEVVRPAVEGTLRVLKAARDAGVKRVVLTSSFGALGFSHHDRSTVTTEADWTDPNEKGLSAYEKSKILAERAAWDFMEKSGKSENPEAAAAGGSADITGVKKTEVVKMELAVINPVAIFGPLLGPSKSPSFGLLKLLLSGSMKAVPNIPLNAVDIRDVADLHIRAMITPEAAGQRFIATADGEISLPEIAKLLREKLPVISGKVSSKTLPDWVIRIGALFNAQAKQGALFLKVNRRVSNAKAKKILGWMPLANNEEAILASAESMKKFGMI